MCVVWVAQSCPTPCSLMGCSPPGPSVHWTVQARTLEWVATSFSRGSSPPRDRTWVSCTAGRLSTIWATREAPCLLVGWVVKWRELNNGKSHAIGEIASVLPTLRPASLAPLLLCLSPRGQRKRSPPSPVRSQRQLPKPSLRPPVLPT